MKKRILKIILLHVLIMAAYTVVVDYLFVTAKEHNPIGSGILEWLCLFTHFFVTALVTGILVIRSTDKRGSGRNMLIHLATIIVLCAINVFIVDYLTADFLWSLRG
jgi:branched-subunit amino acid transport protein